MYFCSACSQQAAADLISGGAGCHYVIDYGYGFALYIAHHCKRAFKVLLALFGVQALLGSGGFMTL